MNPADFLIVIVLGIIVFFAFRYLFRQKKKGCSLCCSECSRACASRNASQHKESFR